MPTIRQKMDDYLDSIGATRVDPSPVSRFHCWHTTDQVPYTVYDWKGKLLNSGMRTRDLYIWIGQLGAVYVTGVSSIHSKRPKSTVQSAVTSSMISSVYSSFAKEDAQ